MVLKSIPDRSVDLHCVAPPFKGVVLFAIWWLISPVGCLGQTSGTASPEISAPKGISIEMPTTRPGKTLLDKPINPKTYVLGPGDVLSIFTWGNFEAQYQLSVSPEGMLLVPEVGPIEVAGLTLDEARKKIETDIVKRYRNIRVMVSLVDLRAFKVYLAGAVKNPGAYQANPVTRVSEVIEMAGGFLDESVAGPQQMAKSLALGDHEVLSSRRNIKIYRRNGRVLEADILRFQLTGRVEFNPRLREGDKIFVPVREPDINLYGIFGAVRNPGYFEFSPGDSLSDLIGLAHGLSLDADSEHAEIVRFRPDHKETFSLFVDLGSPGWNIPLKADDRVFIRSIQGYNEKHQVRLVGEFQHPGYYAITEDSTTLSEIVGKAGGLTEMASLEEAEMTRISAEEIQDPEYERLKKIPISDMTEGELEYYRMKSSTKPGRVSVDFKALFIDKDSTKDIVLRDGDVIVVPRKSQVVNVVGQVSNPGLVPYLPGADYRYYIARAGGFSHRARKSKISIIKGVTGEWRKPERHRPLEAGDTIWVPEKKKRDYWAFMKDTLVFIGNLATVYLVIRQATQ